MKYAKILKALFVPVIACLVFAGCKKGEDIIELDDKGTTYIKILGGGGDPVVKAMDVDPAIETINVLDVRRDANSGANLNQAATVTITNTQAFLDTFNSHNGTHYELLPTAAYTITAASGVTVSGNTWTITLAPGEHARTIDVTLDKSKMDLSKQYGLGFQITQTSSGSVSLSSMSQIVNPLIKNKYDGAYELTGSMADAANAALTGDFPVEYHLATTGASSVVGDLPGTGPYVAILNNGSPSVYGAYCPVFEFDANDKVIKVTNFYGQPASNGRYAALDPSGVNQRDPATGNIDVKFFMYQPAVVALPNPRVTFDWHLEYKGPR